MKLFDVTPQTSTDAVNDVPAPLENTIGLNGFAGVPHRAPSIDQCGSHTMSVPLPFAFFGVASRRTSQSAGPSSANFVLGCAWPWHWM